MADPLWRAFHHERSRAQARDNAVADREVLREGCGAHGELGNDQTLGRNIRRQFPVLARVHDIGSAAQHGNRIAAGSERALVTGAIDAARHPAHKGQARMGEVGREPLRHR